MSVTVLRARSYDDDLERIWLYWRSHSLAFANRTLRKIELRVDRLGQFPDMGERTPLFGDKCRRIIVNRYVVYYERWDDRVEVLRALHAARDVRNLNDP